MSDVDEHDQMIVLGTFLANVPFLQPLKISEKLVVS